MCGSLTELVHGKWPSKNGLSLSEREGELDMGILADLVHEFVTTIKEGRAEIYNEFSLQHELGVFLRDRLPNYKVQFERNVSYFFPSKTSFTKREIDLTVFSTDRSELKYAIELKYPRNGQYPEQMFS